MLSEEDNELVTRVGPGTPMGRLMREYWVPALLSSELLGPDSGPIRVLLLGEKLVAFRDTSGRVGLLPHNCPHRGASLFLGRNEGNGLRCVYHGWKYDVTGRCMDMPSEPAESDFKDKVQPRGYPCIERGGVVWTYMGPRRQPPPMPAFAALEAPPEQQRASALMRDCNWLQALEGDIDTAHVGFLHTGHDSPEDVPQGTFLEYALRDRAPRYKVLDTEFGATYGAYRSAGSDNELYWRIGHFLFPFYAMVPTGVLGLGGGVRAWVPMDDEHTMSILMTATSRRGPSPTAAATPGHGRPMRQEVAPNTSGWFGRFRPVQNEENDYLMDREAQRRGDSYTGIDSFAAEDQAVTESMGPIYDRTQEKLGTSDVMVIRVRRRLIRAAKALMDDGTPPPGLDNPEAYHQRSGGTVLPKDADWIEATRDLRQAGVNHPELDPALAGGI
jgi:nitrite reductase/ring-hydroxylating ferredoxin subunit